MPAVCDITVRAALETSAYSAPGTTMTWDTTRTWGSSTWGQRTADKIYAGRWGYPWAIWGPTVVWGAGGFDPPSWTDLSSAWREITITTGRRDPTASFDVGTLDVTLRSDTMRFHPLNRLSDLYNFMQPNKRFQVIIDGVTIADAWSRYWKVEDRFPGSSITRVPCRDLFGTLTGVTAPALSTPTAAGQTIASRINDITARASLPVESYVADTGTATLQSSTLAGDLLVQAKLAADSDAGYLWVDPTTGKITYKARDWRDTSPRSTAVQWTFTDTLPLAPSSCGASMEIVDPETAVGRIISTLTLARRGGTEQTVTRLDLIGIHGLRSGQNRNDLDCDTDAQVLAIATARINRVQARRDAFSSVTVRPDMSPEARTAVSTVRIHDRVLCNFHIPSSFAFGIPAVTGDHFVEGIEHKINASGKWEATFYLSPA